jgi:hypothetical protein
VRGVALDSLDEIRDQIVAALELHIDGAPRLIAAVTCLDETVVRGRKDHGENDDDGDDNNDSDQEESPLETEDVHVDVSVLRFSVICGVFR